MEESKQQSDAPANVMNAIKQGFDLTTRNLWILVVPVLFDCFLWLGPRLRVAQPIRQQYELMLESVSAETVALEPEAIGAFYEIIEQINLFAMLRTPVFGVPSLMNLVALEKIPVVAQEMVLPDISAILQYSLLLTLIGLAFSGIYYALAATLVQDEEVPQQMIQRLPRNIIRMFLLGLAVYLVLLVVLVPLMFVSSIAAFFSLPLAYIVMIGGSVFVMWAVIFISFSAQAMYLEDRSPFRAIAHSATFMRSNLGRALPLLLIVLVSNSILDQLWLMADNGNWFTLVSIAGHAFVATSLVVATFVFYKDNALTPAI